MRGQAVLLATGVVRSCCVGVAMGLVGVVLGLVGVASGLVGVAPGLVGVVPGLVCCTGDCQARRRLACCDGMMGGNLEFARRGGSGGELAWVKQKTVETQLDVSRVLVIVVVAVGKVRVGLFIRMEQIGGREGDEP
ncbi:hypothetical protein EDB89DRAFT_1903076 [Lactarius sanguifluus]|nr:hypothetical protein EDB89DRAFT_1903635 [Lactarius sanguifluus]KAH9176813.1 hypothetical protein EDB89DRAFT_1903076 [Lactarius sanguifluus]